MINKNKIIVVALCLFILTISVGVIGTYSWYLSSSKQTVNGTMGKVDAKFLNNNSNLSFATKGVSSKTFTIQNNSTIDTYVRIGYTIVYKNVSGQDVFQDTSNVDISNVSLNIGGRNVTAILDKNTSKSNYEKRFIIPVVKSGSSTYYYKLLPGENIDGTITLNAQPEGSNYPNIVLATEVIQSTEKALTEASAYGWNLAYLNKN